LKQGEDAVFEAAFDQLTKESEEENREDSQKVGDIDAY